MSSGSCSLGKTLRGRCLGSGGGSWLRSGSWGTPGVEIASNKRMSSDNCATKAAGFFDINPLSSATRDDYTGATRGSKRCYDLLHQSPETSFSTWRTDCEIQENRSCPCSYSP